MNGRNGAFNMELSPRKENGQPKLAIFFAVGANR
jgi:hypothetical protein